MVPFSGPFSELDASQAVICCAMRSSARSGVRTPPMLDVSMSSMRLKANAKRANMKLDRKKCLVPMAASAAPIMAAVPIAKAINTAI